MRDVIHSGRLCGYDVAVPDSKTGQLTIDGRIDDVRFEINADHKGRVYRVDAEGVEHLITNDVVYTNNHGGEYVMQFTADAETAIGGEVMAPDQHADVVVIRWHSDRSYPKPDPWIQTLFFNDSPTYDKIIGSQERLSETQKRVIDGLKYSLYSGIETAGSWGVDVDGDKIDDSYKFEIYGGVKFTPISADNRYGVDSKDPDGTYVARIAVEFSGNRCD